MTTPALFSLLEVSPLKSRLEPVSAAKSYVIEPVPKDPVTGKPTAEPRIVSVEDFAPALEGFLEAGPDGRVKPVGCFAAGTLVHTAEALQPIEKIRVGTLVLSQPEDGGPRAMRRVVNKFAHLDQPMMAIQVQATVEHGQASLITLFATPNHPFWVDTPLTDDGKHWLAAECLAAGMGLQLADGRRAQVCAAAPIRRTQHQGVFFAADARAQIGQLLCVQDGLLQVAPAGLEASLGTAPLKLGEPYLAPVYNLEVEEFHTYYVGDEAVGVWVHNTGCPVATATAQAMDRAELTKPIGERNPTFCFAAGTLVHTKQGLLPIEQIQVGDLVLSRDENGTEGEHYKRVTRTIRSETEVPIGRLEYYKKNHSEEELEELFVTAMHPFYVKDVGWKPAIDVPSVEELISFNGDSIYPYEFYTLWKTPIHGVAYGQSRIFDRGPTIDFNSGKGQVLQEFQPDEVMGGMSSQWCQTVYNLEVEDFHTYYVGRFGFWVHNLNCSGAGDAGVLQKVSIGELEATGDIYSNIKSSIDKGFLDKATLNLISHEPQPSPG